MNQFQRIFKQFKLFNIILISLIFLIISGCTSQIDNKSDDNTIIEQNPLLGEDLQITSNQELEVFNSSHEIEQFLLEKTIKSSQLLSTTGAIGSTLPMRTGGIMMESSMDMMVSSDSLATPAAAPSMSSSGAVSQRADDVSSTNVQVKGVDEADIIKTDGEFIYTITRNTLTITRAFPPQNLEIIYTKDLEGNSQNMFIQNDSLIVVINEYEDTQRVSQFQFRLQPTYRPQTRVMIFDISNIEEIEIVDELIISGWYNQARMIGDFVYVIAQEQAFSSRGIITPFIDVMDIGRMMPPVLHFNEDDEEFSYTNILSFQVSNLDSNTQRIVNAQSFLLGRSSVVYVSNNNIYLANRNNQFGLYSLQNRVELFKDAILPQYPRNIQNEISRFDVQTEWDEISSIIVSYYDSLSEDELKRTYDSIQEEVSRFETDFLERNMKTTIHSFSIDTDTGVVEFKYSGEVKGYLLNQFSLDEYDSNLRVATTFSIWDRNRRERVEYNNLYVLNLNLDTIGSIENIAPDERIFSVRFMGEKGYIVTFRDVDPLFTIDLSNPTNPQILGELKIDGFSNYLHPFGENHLIGIGKDTEELERGGFRQKGLKLSLFNVEDMQNPIEQDVLVYGEAGSSSAAEFDHKALVFHPTKNLLIIPVSLIEENYRQGFQGILVIKVDEENGFEEVARITHRDDNDRANNDWIWNWWYNSDTTILRSAYLDEYLYTLSNKHIKVHNMDSNFRIENSLEIEYIIKDYYRDGMWYYYD